MKEKYKKAISDFMEERTQFACQIKLGPSSQSQCFWVDFAYFCEDEIIIKLSSDPCSCSYELSSCVSSILPEVCGIPNGGFSVRRSLIEDIDFPCQEVSQDE